jgi:outer membrane protein OmpA-like peptidoglycan-associated protein
MKRRNTRTKTAGGLVAVGLSLFLALNASVTAQEEDELMMRRGASQDEILGAFRSIRRQAAAGEHKPIGVAVRIHFAYDSAELTPEAKAELRNYGKILASDDLRGAHWMIEGHTDASGRASYNMKLSERRARAVYNYLLKEYGISPDAFTPVGMGETKLYDPDHPLSGMNRRVRITYVGE